MVCRDHAQDNPRADGGRHGASVMNKQILGLVCCAAIAGVMGLTPAAAQESDLRIRLERIGRMPTNTNPTSPTVAGSQLLLVDQSGYLYRWDGRTAAALITPKTLPPDVKLLATEPLMNVAANRAGSQLYVMFISTTTPANVPRRTSPREPDGWYLLYEYQFDGTTLSTPRPVTAMQVRSEGHTGGGMTVLDDGSVLFAAGDNGDSYEDGLLNAQNPANHLAKLVQIDPARNRVAQRIPVGGHPTGLAGRLGEPRDALGVADRLGPHSRYPTPSCRSPG
jgi:hypothetical protein